MSNLTGMMMIIYMDARVNKLNDKGKDFSRELGTFIVTLVVCVDNSCYYYKYYN